MKVRNMAKLVRLEGERRQYIKAKRKLEAGRSRASSARRPGGLRGLHVHIDIEGNAD